MDLFLVQKYCFPRTVSGFFTMEKMSLFLGKCSATSDYVPFYCLSLRFFFLLCIMKATPQRVERQNLWLYFFPPAFGLHFIYHLNKRQSMDNSTNKRRVVHKQEPTLMDKTALKGLLHLNRTDCHTSFFSMKKSAWSTPRMPCSRN